jgi:PAS domain-containing protein
MRTNFMPDGSMVSVYTDVSAARAAAQALEVSKARLALALEASGVALWEDDLLSGAVYFSRRWARMLDYPDFDRSVRPEDAMRLIPPEELPRILEQRRDH